MNNNPEFDSDDQLEFPPNSPTENALTVLTVFATIAAVVFFAFGKGDEYIESGIPAEPVGVGSPAPTGISSQQILLPVSHPLPINPIEPIPPYPLGLSGIESVDQYHDVLAIAESIIFVQDYRLKTLGMVGDPADPTEVRDREIVERDVIELIRERIERIDFSEMDERKEMYLRVLSNLER